MLFVDTEPFHTGIVHEFGHSIGMYDEYAGGPIRVRFFDVEGSIMQSGSTVMKQHWTEQPKDHPSIHQNVVDMLGEPYKPLKI